ncbi:unnamed protein product [Cuscuta campestris]|uniref:Ubiquitin-like protease family profile domain-containing protein n=1 Tax=Cuscuta campestris TaxID=132261 RepID=A0A484NG62_9ASTE|nr:unnamed protein product [Cuscuta campestris]
MKMRKWLELKGSFGGRKSLRIDEKEKYAAIENEIREVKKLQVEYGQMLQKILDRLDRHVDDGTRAGFEKCDGHVEGTQIGLSEGVEESGDKSEKGNEAKLESNMEKRRTNGEENDKNIELNKSENEVVEKESMCVAGYKFELAETQYGEDVLAELDVIERNTVESKQNEKEDDIYRLKTYLEKGMLKRMSKSGGRRMYTKEEDNLENNPLILDVHTVNNKTWLYDLFMDQEWLGTLHIEVGMFYLEVKRFHYKLSQKYGTTTPFFMDALKKHHDKVGAKGKTARDVGSIKNLTSEILGKVRRCAIKWADADFVYIPLNTGKHWILLVLEIEGKTIWVYNSMRGKSTGLKDMAAYIACIKHLLPKLLDACGVYKQHPSGPMGNQEIRINEALNCPQQTDQ